MSSTPLMASSIGVATVSATTVGLAPGYWARTTTEGGTTSGYSEIGSARSASRPVMKMRTDRTPAKIGRSTKNRETFMAAVRAAGAILDVARSGGDRIGARRGGRRGVRLHRQSGVHRDRL